MSRVLYHAGQIGLCASACTASWAAFKLVGSAELACVLSMLAGWTCGILAGVRLHRDIWGEKL